MPRTTYAAPAGPVPAYLAVPDGDGPWPGVVVVHDAFGMTADTRRITDRFAAHGYLALAPALYRRGRRIGCIVSIFRALSAGRGTGVDDLVAARDHLAADPRCTGKADPSTLTRSCPVGASYGARDRKLSGAAAKLDALLAEGGVPRDVEEYPGVGHSFMNDWGTPAPLRVVERAAGLACSEPEAEDAWRRILAFFGEHLARPADPPAPG